MCPTKCVGYRFHIVIEANWLTRVFYTFRRVQVTQFVIVKKRVFVSHVMYIYRYRFFGWAMWTRQGKVYFEHKIMRRLWGGVGAFEQLAKTKAVMRWGLAQNLRKGSSRERRLL